MVRKTFVQVLDHDHCSKATEIKNLLNRYLVKRLERVKQGDVIDDKWLDDTEAGCQTMIQHLGVRKSLAREHAVNYILQERGIAIFGVTN
jgi:hypothetical protein